jgi:hypothetical protein
VTRVISDPQPGFFVTRLVRGGPMVPAVIWRPCPLEIDPYEGIIQPLDRYPHLRARILDRDVHPETVWAAGRAVPMAEWRFLTAMVAWARIWAPDHPLANPKTPIAIEKMAAAF